MILWVCVWAACWRGVGLHWFFMVAVCVCVECWSVAGLLGNVVAGQKEAEQWVEADGGGCSDEGSRQGPRWIRVSSVSHLRKNRSPHEALSGTQGNGKDSGVVVTGIAQDTASDYVKAREGGKAMRDCTGKPVDDMGDGYPVLKSLTDLRQDDGSAGAEESLVSRGVSGHWT